MKKLIVLGVLAFCSISLLAQELVIFRDHRSLEVRNHREEKSWTYLSIGSGEMAVRTADILKIVRENVTATPAPIQEHAAPAPGPPVPPHPAPTPSMQHPRPFVPSMYPTFRKPPRMFRPPPAEQKEQMKNEENAEEEDMDEGAEDGEEAEPPQAPQVTPSTAPRTVTIPLRTLPKKRGK